MLKLSDSEGEETRSHLSLKCSSKTFNFSLYPLFILTRKGAGAREMYCGELYKNGWSGISPKRHFTETAFHRNGISPNALLRDGSPNDLRRAFGELKAAFHLLLPFTEWTINSL
jgi:hypothetical protein